MPTNAIYHPWIDPTNGSTIRTAILYFDEMRTIVPESMRTPFDNLHTRAAYDLGFLRPRIIHSNDPCVITASDEFIRDYQRPIIQRSGRESRERVQGMDVEPPHYLSGDKVLSRPHSWCHPDL